MNLKHLIASVGLLIAAGASSAECRVTHNELVYLTGKPMAEAKAILASDEHTCAVVVNGVLGQFGRWLQLPEATGHPWKAGDVVVTADTGHEGRESRDRDTEIRFAIGTKVVCPDGKLQCPLPISKQMPGREDFKFWAREPDASMVEVFTRIAEEEGRYVVWVDDARDIAAKPLRDRESMNTAARLRKVYTSAEALQGVTGWYAATALPSERLSAAIKGDTVEVWVVGGNAVR